MKNVDSDQEKEFKKNEAFERKIFEKGGNKAAIGRTLGDVSGQLIGQYVNGRQKPKDDFFRKWEAAYGEDIRELFETNVSHEIKNIPNENRSMTDQAILNLTESNRMMAEAMLIDAKNREKFADSNRDLVSMVKEGISSDDFRKIQLNVSSSISALLEELAEIGTKAGRWHTKDEALAALNKYVHVPELSER